jgi:hypothetical protein
MNKELYKYVDKNSPKELKFMAAKGLVTSIPKDMIEILYLLTFDPDDEISREANNTLKNLPDNIINAFLSLSDTNPDILHYIAKNSIDRDDILEKIILNRSVSDNTLLYLAPIASERIGNIIANNHYRLIRTPEIIDALIDNPNLSRAVKEGLSFLIEDSLSIPKKEENIGKKVALIENKGGISEEMIEDRELSKKEYDNLYKKIQNMSVPEKIKLALLGNKEARGILIKDPNKVVSTAVLRNPKITESEIVMIAKSRNISEEVIRVLANNKEWTKNYQVKLSLLANPKTPIQISLKFLNTINYKDLSILSKSRNIPNIIALTARKLLMTKEKSLC